MVSITVYLSRVVFRSGNLSKAFVQGKVVSDGILDGNENIHLHTAIIIMDYNSLSKTSLVLQ